MGPLLSQIVRLTKNVHLKQPSIKSYRSQFIAGNKSPWSFVGGFGLCWWYTDETFYAVEAVVDLTLRHSTEFKDCDRETVSEVVKKTLQEVCLDSTIFDGDSVAFSQRETLFDCRSGNVPEFSNALFDGIARSLRARMGRRCTIHALPRFRTKSFRIDSELLHVIAKDDVSAWSAIESQGYQFDGWTPENPYLGSRKGGEFAPPRGVECLLVAEENGTQKGTRFNSILQFRKLTAVMLAVASKKAGRLFGKSGADPLGFCLQLPHKSSPDRVATRNDCSPIAPYFVDDIDFESDDIAHVHKWYECYWRCPEDVRIRIEKAAHFLNRGLNADDIESYVNYYVTLDALFGERGSVEASILQGLAQIGIPSEYLEKTPWLFELRNELVHGGSRFIAEWPKHIRYTQHFRSKPMTDVQLIAQLAVLQAPIALAV